MTRIRQLASLATRDRDTRFALIWLLVALALFVGSSRLQDIPVGNPYGDFVISDIGGYHEVADGIGRGRSQLGLKDPFSPDSGLWDSYPPGAIALFMAAWFPELPLPSFEERFRLFLIASGLALVVLLYTSVLARLTRRREIVALALALGLSPWAIGQTAFTHFDLVPAFALGLAVSALLRGHHRLAAGALAAGAMLKVYPAFFAPLLAIHLWRTRGGRAVGEAVLVFAVVCYLFALPIALQGPGLLLAPFLHQIGRPLQVESTGAGLLLAAGELWGFPIEIASGFGSQNVAGPGAAEMKSLSLLAFVGAQVAIWVWMLRRPASPSALGGGLVAAVALLIATNSVLSPSYMSWIVGVLPYALLGPRRRLLALGYAGALLTSAWVPARYFEYIDREATWVVWLILLRSALFVLLAIGLLRAAPEPPAPPAIEEPPAVADPSLGEPPAPPAIEEPPAVADPSLGEPPALVGPASGRAAGGRASAPRFARRRRRGARDS